MPLKGFNKGYFDGIFVPYTGANADVDLGSKNLATTGSITLSDWLIFNDDNVPTTRRIKVDTQTTNNTAGNALIVQSAQGLGTGAGGNLTVVAGEGGATGAGGDVTWQAGDGGVTSGNAGDVTIAAGWAQAGNSDGGDVHLQPGDKAGTGTAGQVFINDPASSLNAILDTTLIATANKTFQFPNLSGEIALMTTVQATNFVTTGTGRFDGGLLDDAGTPLLSVDIANRELYYSDGSTVSVGWQNSILVDTGANFSVDWDSRFLYASGGAVITLDWSSTDGLLIPTDSLKLFFGSAADSYIEFDGDSMNIVANDVTATDDLTWTAHNTLLTAGGRASFNQLDAPPVTESYRKASYIPVVTADNNETPFYFERAATPLTTPTSDASGDCTHPDILYIPGGWNGYTYWMIMTPFLGSSTQVENPEVIASNDGETWTDPGSNPIAPSPGGANDFNSDVCLMFYQNTLYAYWREAIKDNGNFDITVECSSSTDGVNWSAPVTVLGPLNTAVENTRSPVVRNIYGTFYMWTVDSVPSPDEVNRRSSATPTGTFANPQTCTLTNNTGEEVFHISHMWDGDAFYGLWKCTNLIFVRSYDGLNWELNGVEAYAGTVGEWDAITYTTAMLRRHDRPYFDVFYSGWTVGGLHRIGRGKLHFPLDEEAKLYGYKETNNVRYVTFQDARLRVKDTVGAVINVVTESDTTTANFDPRIHFQHGATPATKFTMGVDASDSYSFKIGTANIDTTKLTLDTSGNLTLAGNIITPTLTALSKVFGTSVGAELRVMELRNNAVAASTATALKFTNSTSSGSGSGSEINSIRTNSPSNGSSDLILRTSLAFTLTERLRILAGGNVGIGTTSPDTKLQVVGTTKFGDDNTNYVTIETDGDMNFVGGGGLEFGEIYYHGAGFGTTCTDAGTFYQILGFDTDGESNGSVVPAHGSDHITVGKAGRYQISFSASCRSGNSDEYEFMVCYNDGPINGTACLNLMAHRDTSVAAALGVVACTGICDLPANATVELWVNNVDTGGRDIDIEHVTLSVVQLGGTT